MFLSPSASCPPGRPVRAQSPSEYAPGVSLAGPATDQCYKSGVTTAYPWVRVACGAVGQNATLSVYTTQVCVCVDGCVGFGRMWDSGG